MLKVIESGGKWFIHNIGEITDEDIDNLGKIEFIKLVTSVFICSIDNVKTFCSLEKFIEVELSPEQKQKLGTIISVEFKKNMDRYLMDPCIYLASHTRLLSILGV